jgi:hypothetical protein
MLMAYEDIGLQIKDIPTEDTRVPLYPIKRLPTAMRIIAAARMKRRDLKWAIERKNGKKGPYRVVGTPKS